MRHTESEVQGLKAQEAKDYCVELMHQLSAKTGGPISPGEVQLQELQYELKLKEAESEDNRQRELHEQRLKELELEIEQERRSQSEAQKLADEVRAGHSETIAQVAQSQEKLSVQLERATREHNVKTQMLQAQHDEQQTELNAEIEELSARRDALVDEIGTLAELKSAADGIDRLRQELEQQQEASVRQQKELDVQIEAAVFEKQKELTIIRREQEMELAETEAQHRKSILDMNLGAADELLKKLEYTKVQPAELSALKAQAAEQNAKSEQEVEAIRQDAIEELKHLYNISSSDAINVTELFYDQKRLCEENEAHENHIKKLDAEVARMRTHIEKESERVAKAIESARTNIQNNIEPGVQR